VHEILTKLHLVKQKKIIFQYNKETVLDQSEFAEVDDFTEGDDFDEHDVFAENDAASNNSILSKYISCQKNRCIEDCKLEKVMHRA
jgi:hypothetical protein